jgi:hypothetical protein|tara:strand:+ start:1065 stop:1268 length:204 start_codon:yes stop_codon:yes gene_type:complete
MIVNTDNENFSKDLSTGALINNNKGALEAYRKAKEKSNRVLNLETEIYSMKRELENIRELLIQIANR